MVLNQKRSLVLLRILFSVLGCSCASTDTSDIRDPYDATPEHSVPACIADSPFPPFQAKTLARDRLLPEMVRIIGSYDGPDGRMLMVIRGVYDSRNCVGEKIKDRRSCDWQPWPIEKVQVWGCGPSAR